MRTRPGLHRSKEMEQQLPVPAASSEAPWFVAWASSNNLQEFARLVTDADLVSFVEGSETPLTLFAPSNDAIQAVAHKLPGDVQLLRELVCVHITMSSIRSVRSRGSTLGLACRRSANHRQEEAALLQSSQGCRIPAAWLRI